MWREHIESLERTRDVQLGKQVDLGPAHVLALGAPEDTGQCMVLFMIYSILCVGSRMCVYSVRVE